MGWLTSPAAWSQFALLAVSLGLAVLVNRRILPVVEAWLRQRAGGLGLLPTALRFSLLFLPMILPLIAYGSPPLLKLSRDRCSDRAP